MRMRRRQREAGLTLIELMIAIALMLVMTLQLQIIFGHSRKLFLGADALAQVYSNTRTALDQIEKDLANAVKSDQMEFYNDRRSSGSGIGHYNTGEENPAIQGRVIPGKYIHSLVVKQPKKYDPKDMLKVGGPYRHDSLYFRTFTNIMGTPREALVEYKLWLGNDDRDPRPRPVLQRIVTGPKIDKDTGMPVYAPDGYPIYERLEAQDMCYYVQEFKVELFIRDKRKTGRVGRFYSPEEAITFNTTDDATPPRLTNLLAGQEFAVECLDRSPNVPADVVDPAAIMVKLDPGVGGPRLHLRNGDRMARIGPGDKLYCVGFPSGGGTPLDFKSSYLTVKEVIPPATPTGGETVVSFENETEIQAAMGNYIDLPVAYRGAWLPAAVRVQMKIKDARSTEVRTISRIFRLLKA